MLALAPAVLMGGVEAGEGDERSIPPPAMDDRDEDLIRRCARGDADSFARILARHRVRVFQLVRWWLGPGRPWAEDVAQEVFLQVFRSAGTFAGRSSFKTWLYGLAFNVCRRYRRQEVRAGDTDGLPAEGAATELRDASLDPLARLEEAERARLVRRAVEALSPLHRTILHLREWEELSYSEISAVMEIPVGTVRSRLHNARAALADRLEEMLEG